MVAIDAMLSVYAHELVEAVSDPLLNAWFDNTGYENADKCAVSLPFSKSFSGNGTFITILDKFNQDITMN